jgi:hypothetical protein
VSLMMSVRGVEGMSISDGSMIGFDHIARFKGVLVCQ